jgi:hypothetical protein
MFRWLCPGIIGISAVLAMPAGPPATGQEATHALETVVRDPAFITDPIKNVRMLHQGKPVESHIPFEGDEDWLKGMSVEVENISHKTLTCAIVTVVFRSLGHPLVVGFATIGQLPEHRRILSDGTVEPDSHMPIAIKSGQKFVIPFQPTFEQMKTRISQRAKLSDVHYCEIWLSHAYFDDGTMWQAQTFFKETKDRTNNYDRSTPEEFYGAYSGPIRD